MMYYFVFVLGIMGGIVVGYEAAKAPELDDNEMPIEPEPKQEQPKLKDWDTAQYLMEGR